MKRREAIALGLGLTAAIITNPKLISADPWTGEPQDIRSFPLMPKEEALELFLQKQAEWRIKVPRKSLDAMPYPLQLINETRQLEGQVGFVMGHGEGYQATEPLHIAFPVKPQQYWLHDHRVKFLALTNNASEKFPPRPYRRGETYLEMMKEFFATGVWMANSSYGKYKADTRYVLEVEDLLSKEVLCNQASEYDFYDFKNEIPMNEIDDPGAYWRRKEGLLASTFKKLRECSQERSLIGRKQSLPGLTYVDDTPRRIKTLSKTLFKGVESDTLNVHAYTPANDKSAKDLVIQGAYNFITDIDKSVREVYGKPLNLVVRELGYPGLDHPITEFNDWQLADCWIPAVIAELVATKLVERVFCYTFYSPNQSNLSQVDFKNDRWVYKPTHIAARNINRILARIAEVNGQKQVERRFEEDSTQVLALREDGIGVVIPWANRDQKVLYKRPKGGRGEVIVVDFQGKQYHGEDIVCTASPAPPDLTGKAFAVLTKGEPAFLQRIG